MAASDHVAEATRSFRTGYLSSIVSEITGPALHHGAPSATQVQGSLLSTPLADGCGAKLGSCGATRQGDTYFCRIKGYCHDCNSNQAPTPAP